METTWAISHSNSGKDVLTAMDAKLSQDELIKVDYDYEKFKAEFEKEMNKRAGGQ